VFAPKETIVRAIPIAFLVAAVWVLHVAPAQAELGASPTDFGTRGAGATRARALSAAAAGATYSVNETPLTSGTTVREYVGPDGNVFAVSWAGPFMPDLRALLGKHFVVLTGETAKLPKAGHSQVNIVRPEVTIEAGGHMRAFVGRAWIEVDFPRGFMAADVE
jgi:hypothetical protein